MSGRVGLALVLLLFALPDDQVSPTMSLCRDYGTGPWSHGFTRTYQRTTGFEARDSLMRVAAGVARAETEAKGPRMQEIEARIPELTQQVVAAAEKGDMARIESLNKEMEKVPADYARLLEEGEALEAMEAVEEASRDGSFRIAVDFDLVYMWPAASAVPLDVPGAAAAYRWGEKGEGQALILIGPWPATSTGADYSECSLCSGEKPETAQTAVVLGVAQGRRSRADAAAYAVAHGVVVSEAGDPDLEEWLHVRIPDEGWRVHAVVRLEPPPESLHLFGYQNWEAERPSNKFNGYAALARHRGGGRRSRW